MSYGQQAAKVAFSESLVKDPELRAVLQDAFLVGWNARTLLAEKEQEMYATKRDEMDYE